MCCSGPYSYYMAQLVFVSYTSLLDWFQRLGKVFYPLHLISRKSLSGTVKSVRLHVQCSSLSPPASPGGHTIPAYCTSQAPHPLKGESLVNSPTIHWCCFYF